MPRNRKQFDDDWWIGIWDDYDLDDKDEFQGGSKVNQYHTLVHVPDVEVEFDSYAEDDDFNYGIQIYQFSAHDKTEKVNDECYMANQDGDGDCYRDHLDMMRRYR